MRALADAFGVFGAVIVIVASVWIVAHSRGLRRHRIDLHVYVHHDGEDESDE